jgi:hypothetical protein
VVLISPTNLSVNASLGLRIKSWALISEEEEKLIEDAVIVKKEKRVKMVTLVSVNSALFPFNFIIAVLINCK